MITLRRVQPAAWVLAPVLIVAIAHWAAAQPGSPPGSHEHDGPPPREGGPPDSTAEKDRPSEQQWIGIRCEPVSDDLRAQFHLGERTGLLVMNVVPKSAAAKADIHRFDILLKANDKELKDVDALVSEVQAAGTKELTLTLMRGGKETTAKVTPEERPEFTSPDSFFGGPRDRDEMRRRMRMQMERGGGMGGPGMNMRMFRPGVRMDIPDDLKITITREGKKPAQVAVEQGDKKWNVAEDKLGDLPENIRPYVEAMVGHPPRGLSEGRGQGGPRDGRGPGGLPDGRRGPDRDLGPGGPAERGGPPERDGDHPQRGPRDRFGDDRPEGPPFRGVGGPGGPQQRLEELDRKVEELRKLLEELKESKPKGN